MPTVGSPLKAVIYEKPVSCRVLPATALFAVHPIVEQQT